MIKRNQCGVTYLVFKFIVIMRDSVRVPLLFSQVTHFESLSPHLSFQGLLVFVEINFGTSVNLKRCSLLLFHPFTLNFAYSQSFPAY